MKKSVLLIFASLLIILGLSLVFVEGITTNGSSGGGGGGGSSPAPCMPSCVGKQCGSNGCGGSCGTCASGQTCNSVGQCIGSSTINSTTCQNLYWFDNTNKECGYKQFCGAYLYQGLRTFENKSACQDTLRNNNYCDSIGEKFCKNDSVLVTCEEGGTSCAGGTGNCYTGYSQNESICSNGCENGACVEGNTTITHSLCTDSDGGKNYYVQGTVQLSPNCVAGQPCIAGMQVETDQCICHTTSCAVGSNCPVSITSCSLQEYFCSNNKIESEYYNCPNGCKDGVCIQVDQCKSDADCPSTCSLCGNPTGSSYESCMKWCIINKCVNGKCTQGDYSKVVAYLDQKFKLSLKGNAIIEDFGDMNIYFIGIGPNGGIVLQVSMSSGNVSTATQIQIENGGTGEAFGSRISNLGISNEIATLLVQKIEGSCAIQKCDDGTSTECKKLGTGECVCSTCPPIIIPPVCGNGICEGGEGEICACPMIACAEGKECKMPPCQCNIGCPQDCKTTEPIYANLNEKFKLEISQPVKILENGNSLMKITFKDLIAYKCATTTVGTEASGTINTKVAIATGNVVASETSAGGAGGGGMSSGSTPIIPVMTNTPATPSVEIIKCIGAGPKALLDVDFAVTNESNHNILNLDLGEQKQVGEFAVSFVSYDYASRTGTFLVQRKIIVCPKNCKCSLDGKTVTCPTKECLPGTILCPDGTCSKKCNIIDEECKYGCNYEGKCFPMSIRSNGMYCGTNLIMSSQKEKEDKCENNFECKTNVCVDGKCISSNVIQKFLSWIKNMFGGK